MVERGTKSMQKAALIFVVIKFSTVHIFGAFSRLNKVLMECTVDTLQVMQAVHASESESEHESAKFSLMQDLSPLWFSTLSYVDHFG